MVISRKARTKTSRQKLCLAEKQDENALLICRTVKHTTNNEYSIEKKRSSKDILDVSLSNILQETIRNVYVYVALRVVVKSIFWWLLKRNNIQQVWAYK
jgi:hypothetical protein